MSKIVDVPWVLQELDRIMVDKSQFATCALYVGTIGLVLRFKVVSRVLSSEELAGLMKLAKKLGTDLLLCAGAEDLKDRETGALARYLEATMTIAPVRVELESSPKTP